MTRLRFKRVVRRQVPGRPGAGEPARPRLRCFPGWAGTLLWWPHPVDYVDTALPAELIVELTDWEARWEGRASAEMDGLRAHDPVAEADEQRLLIGLSLRVAEHLGSGYSVEVDAPRRPGRAILRRRKVLLAADGPGTPAVVAAFEALEAEAADDLSPRRRPGVGSKSRLYAYAPLSGETFDPSGGRRRRQRDDAP
ncbi:hypothetical protein [Zhihengliuella halotolerans]|uniref:hypothetical protein n=1 Tax=Zhihengliuella halotolerans TaxID=370736 RepID=UPI000C8023CB|nr:hypothetical protein [Zhihengliuella halotolerans]